MVCLLCSPSQPVRLLCRSSYSVGRLGGVQGPEGRVVARQRLLIKRPGMARCLPPKGSHSARGGAPIAVRIASPVPIMILIDSSRTRRSRLILERARVLAGPEGRAGPEGGSSFRGIFFKKDPAGRDPLAKVAAAMGTRAAEALLLALAVALATATRKKSTGRENRLAKQHVAPMGKRGR